MEQARSTSRSFPAVGEVPCGMRMQEELGFAQQSHHDGRAGAALSAGP